MPQLVMILQHKSKKYATPLLINYTKKHLVLILEEFFWNTVNSNQILKGHIEMTLPGTKVTIRLDQVGKVKRGVWTFDPPEVLEVGEWFQKYGNKLDWRG